MFCAPENAVLRASTPAAHLDGPWQVEAVFIWPGAQVVPFKRKIYEELARQFIPVIEKMQADQG